MHGDPALVARAPGAPGRPGPRLAAQPGRGRRRGRPALRQLGRRPRARPTTSASCCPHTARIFAGVADLDVPRIHFGVGTGELLGLMAAAGRRRRRRRLAGPARRGRRAGRRGPAPCRATSTRRCASAPWAVVEAEVRRRAGRAAAATRRPHLQPRPRRAARDRPGDARAGRRAGPRRGPPRPASRTDPGMSASAMSRDRRGRHGLRHPGVARRRRGLLHRHPAGPAADRRAAGRAAPAATTPSAGSRRWPSAPRPSGPAIAAALDERAPGRVRGRARPEARRALHRGRRGRRWPTSGVDPRRRARAGAALLRRRASASTRRGPPTAGAEHGVGRAPPSTAGTSSPPTSTSWPPRWPRPAPTMPDAAPGPVHRPLAARAGAGRRPLPRPAARERGRGRRAGRARPVGRLGHRLAERGPHPRAVAGSRHPRGHPRPGRDRPQRGRRSCARRASRPTTSRCSTTSTSRPRAVAAEARARLRPHPLAQRRPRRSWRRWPTWSCGHRAPTDEDTVSLTCASWWSGAASPG